MIGPIVCFSCNRRLSRTVLQVETRVARGETVDNAMSAEGLRPVEDLCCRRMLLCQPQYWSTVASHDDRNKVYNGVSMQRNLAVPRTLDCV